ncbi:MAG: restriction endonuclease [Anaerolineales bacterium]|nr:restriction endonuclease [Anaerolineales bacterium]
MTNNTLWGIHAGATGEADSLFIKKKVIALGWPEVGDLSKIPANREAFKSAVAVAYPNIKKGAIPVYGGLLFRFVHEMKIGDVVIYPSKIDRQIHIGGVEGEYQYQSDSSGYPNQRAVKWLKTFPRTQFTQGALYEIGSAVTLFQVKNYADEFNSVLEGKPAPVAPEEDETVALVAQEIEQTTSDYILKKLAQDLKGHPFAEFVAHVLNCMGYYTRLAKPGPDGGVDIYAHKDELGFEPPIIKVQVKSSGGNIGLPEVTALYGNVGEKEFGLFVTLSAFTSQAVNFARNKTNLRLIDSEELIKLIFAHYEQFDTRYKGLLPLKRVYVPETTPDQEG